MTKNEKIEDKSNGECLSHPNGQPIRSGRELRRPAKKGTFFIAKGIFPDNTYGNLLSGLVTSFLIKQEHRLGWARKSACDDPVLLPHPCEVVAAHQWGVAWLVSTISKLEEFKKELPTFDCVKALDMAMLHDQAEIETGDITPVDGISPEQKHKLELSAMSALCELYPKDVQNHMSRTYATYEDRKCSESKFVKDCDKLDFIITAFLLERQGFKSFEEFYPNSVTNGFSTEVATKIAETLITTRNKLFESNQLYYNTQS